VYVSFIVHIVHRSLMQNVVYSAYIDYFSFVLLLDFKTHNSDNAIWSRECGRLPILPLPICRQSSVAAPMAVDQRLAVCTDAVVIRGKHCDSTSSWASLICKRSD